MRPFLAASTCVILLWFPNPASAQGLPSAKPEEVGLSSQRLGRIGAALRVEIEKKQFPGAVAVVARKGRVAYFQSFGSLDPSRAAPMTNDAIFRIYSMTKPLASVAAMMLVEEGKIVLTDPVSKYLPAFSKMQVSVQKVDPASGKANYELVPAESEMTIQDLFRHTSGLAYGEITTNGPVKEAYAKAGVFQPDGPPYDARGITPAEEVERLAKAPLAYHPGKVWNYSLSVDVLGRVVEVASGMRLSEFLEARLFKPLKMVDTAFQVPAGKMGRLAQAFPDDPVTGKPVKVIDVSAPPKNDSAGAGAVSTAGDYLRFAQMLLNGGRLDGVRILGRPTIALMTSDQLGKIADTGLTPGELLLGTRGYTFGLGFSVRLADGIAGTTGRAGEFMWAGAAGTYFWIDPREQLVGILMIQLPTPSRVYYRKLMKQLVYQAIDD